MNTTFPQPPTQPQQQEEHPATCASLSAFPDLSTLSTLWVPLHEVRQAWAAFGQEVLTPLCADGNEYRLWGPVLGNSRAPAFHLGSPGA